MRRERFVTIMLTKFMGLDAFVGRSNRDFHNLNVARLFNPFCLTQGEDSVVECANEDGEIALHMSWNSGKSNKRHPMVRATIFATLKPSRSVIIPSGDTMIRQNNEFRSVLRRRGLTGTRSIHKRNDSFSCFSQLIFN